MTKVPELWNVRNQPNFSENQSGIGNAKRKMSKKCPSGKNNTTNSNECLNFNLINYKKFKNDACTDMKFNIMLLILSKLPHWKNIICKVNIK